MKTLLRRIAVKALSWMTFGDYGELRGKLQFLETRVHNHRWFAIEEVMGYLVGAQLPGDYCEFGVYKGDTFGHGMRASQPLLPKMRYIAFDSFEGLPEPKGVDALGGFTSNFHKNEFACDEKTFLHNISTIYHGDLSRVITVPGWFDETLTPETAQKIKLEKVAAAWIDCDLYESCVPVLDFLTDKLSIGSILIFDDWRAYRNLPDRGVQLACREWLEKHPAIKLAPVFSFAHFGFAFSVLSCE